MYNNPFNPGYYETEDLSRFGFGAVGKNVKISKDCTIVGLSKIFFGNDIRIDSRVSIIVTSGCLTLAGMNHLGGRCRLSVAADIKIGLHSGLSQGVGLYTSTDGQYRNHMVECSLPIDCGSLDIRPISIGDYCIFGAGAIVLPGGSAANGVAVGALSVVTEPLEEWTLYHGNPARRVRKRGRCSETFGEELAAASSQ